MVHDDDRGHLQKPWGPEAHRRRLVTGIEDAAFTILRSFSAASVASTEGMRKEKSQAQGDLVSQLMKLLFGRDSWGLIPDGLGHGEARLPWSNGKSLRFRRGAAILDSVHALLVSGRHATPRELFYTHVALFTRQQQCDDMLKRLCVALEVPRHYLHVVGTAKGLVRGHLRIYEPNVAVFDSVGRGESTRGVWIDGMDPLQPRGHTIAPICAHIVQVETVARTVLVIEKETIFQRLLDEGVLEQHRPIIVVTARGNPDVPSRYFLRRLHQDCASPRVLLLVDADAFGLSIAFTYAFGPEKSQWIHDDLALPEAELLGCAGLQVAEAQARFGLGRDDVMQLTPRDVAVIAGVQRRLAALRFAGIDSKRLDGWESAATRLLAGGVKYELDALDRLSEFVSRGIRRTDAP
eukprot:TRINITY_DN21473_c0_g1_i1.p1 TRINITY_DN21473_c0_g1~~TRINITY_DN21473_c0_g1_i1.p1  ORF type:complete len:433 (+),score=72.53 TRINITY_DN21473_c0_g1_i1:80-1300(+)